MEPAVKKCLACGKPLKGRSDKKFCDDYCRNVYNNQAKNVGKHIVRNINNALKKNRQILSELIKTGQKTVKVDRGKLAGLGFKFKWHTHLYTNSSNSTYYFCYDYGYLLIGNGWYLVVRENETKE